MPTYVYRRPDGTTFEVSQRMSDAPLSVDPESGQPVQRVIGGGGLIFKGSGFYLTDYARKPEGEASAVKPTQPAKPAADPKPATTTTTSADGA